MNQKDYYNILCIGGNASQEQIKAAYRKLAFQYHPDRNRGDPAATEKMKEVNEAYAVLSNPAKRADYDLLRERYGSYASDRYRQAHSPQDIFRGSDIDQVFQEFARQFGFRDFGDIFQESYGQDYRSFEFRGSGMSGRGFVFYRRFGRTAGTQEELQQQPVPELPFPGPVNSVMKFLIKRLTGFEFPEKGKDWKDTIALSIQMAQGGGEVKYRYNKWGKAKNLMVTIPAGIKDSQQIRLKEMGGPGKGGASSGDLYLKVRIEVPLLERVKAWLRL